MSDGSKARYWSPGQTTGEGVFSLAEVDTYYEEKQNLGLKKVKYHAASSSHVTIDRGAVLAASLSRQATEVRGHFRGECPIGGRQMMVGWSDHDSCSTLVRICHALTNLARSCNGGDYPFARNDSGFPRASRLNEKSLVRPQTLRDLLPKERTTLYLRYGIESFLAKAFRRKSCITMSSTICCQDL